MNQKWDRMIGLLFENPNESYSVREISKKTKIPSSSVQRYLEKLRKDKFIDEDNRIIVNSYSKFKKAFFMIDKIYHSGLIEYIERKLVPETVILFGSIRKGEYDIKSDIDLFVSSTKNTELELIKFQNKLGHKIELFIEPNIDNLPKHLYNNVINGIKISGYFTVK